MKKKVNHIVTLILLLYGTAANAQNDFAKIRTAIYNNLQQEQTVEVLDKVAMPYTSTADGSGVWNDIAYNSTQRTDWPGHEHINRLELLAKAFTNKDSRYYNATPLYESIIKGLRYWYDKDYQSANWWYNQIAIPQGLGQILVLMKEGLKVLPTDLEKSLVERMNRGQMWQQTGANKLDVALHNIYRAALTEDAALMDSAVQAAFQPISFTTGEGLQHDYSNMQHGRQIMIGSYGFVFINGEYKVASYLHGTRYAITPEKLKLLSTYFYQVFLKAIRGSYMDFNTEGRGISRRNILDKRITVERRSLSNLLTIATLLDENNAPFLKYVGERLSQTKTPSYGIVPYHNHFWKADYTLHLRPAYSFNVRTNSVRTVRTETGNEENLLGNFLPDGATNIQRSGGEYNNIQLIWEWDKIPGITCRDYATDEGARIKKEWGIAGTKAFVGGVSDSLYGSTAYEVNFDSITAKKAWFFFDNEVICLGAGINSNAPESITTTINQCWQKGKVLSSGFTDALAVNSRNTLQNPKWIWHDSIAYFFPIGGNISVSNTLQTGDWYRINKSQTKGIVTGNVFKLWFNHGAKPVDRTYSYIVVPGLNNAKAVNTYNIADIIIEQNTKDIQAVRHKGLNMLQTVFYKAGMLSNGLFSLSVDKPCIIYIKNINTKNRTLYIADPLQQADIINVQWQQGSLKKNITCKMPKDVYAGSTVKYNIN